MLIACKFFNFILLVRRALGASILKPPPNRIPAYKLVQV